MMKNQTEFSKTVGGQNFQRDFVDEKKVCSDFRKFLHRNFLDARNRRVADFRFPRSTRFVVYEDFS